MPDREDVIRISVRQMQGANQGMVLSAALKSQPQEPGVKDRPRPLKQPVARDRSLPATGLLGEEGGCRC